MKPLTDELRESMINIIVSRELVKAEDYLEDWVDTVMREGFEALTERSDEALVEAYLSEVAGDSEADNDEDDWEAMTHIASQLLSRHGLVDMRLAPFFDGAGAGATTLLSKAKAELMRRVDEVDAMLARIGQPSHMSDEEYAALAEDAAEESNELLGLDWILED